MMRCNDEYALKKSIELTTIAMEHSMIKATANPEETANNVYKFISTLFNNLTSENPDNK